ncbi:MAG: photosynthetic reaction center subunit H [Pseudomonadota bacterium]
MLVEGMGNHLDLAIVTLYIFWIFFAGLIFYLRREDRREGYPLVAEPPRRGRPLGPEIFPLMPEPKTFELESGETVLAPAASEKDTREVNMHRSDPWPGSPWEPSGDPMVDGVGPASWAMRSDVPDMTHDGLPKIVPLRAIEDHTVDEHDYDPRGMNVVGLDKEVAGKVTEIWADRAEMIIRYLEVDANGRTVLVPMTLCRVHGSRDEVEVDSVKAEHFGKAPLIAGPDQVTLLEEDKIVAFFAGGHLYASPDRMGPIL